jgi:hypothetical protein
MVWLQVAEFELMSVACQVRVSDHWRREVPTCAAFDGEVRGARERKALSLSAIERAGACQNQTDDQTYP